MITDIKDIAIDAFYEMTTLPRLNHIVQHGRELATVRFTLTFEDGPTLEVPNGDILFSRTQMTKLLAISHAAMINPGKQIEWLGVIAGLLRNATIVEEDPDERLSSSVEDWLAQYADSNGSRDRAGAARRRSPFFDPDTGLLHVNIDHFARWVKTTLMAQVTTRELRLAVKDLGWKDTRVDYTIEGHGRTGRKRSTTRYWHEPRSPDTDTAPAETTVASLLNEENDEN